MAAASAATPVAQGASGIQGQKLRQRCSRAGAARRARSVTSAKAIAEAGAATKLNKAEWNSLGSVCAVLGSQWGDEGKGKLVDILAQVSQREIEKWLSPTPQPFPPPPHHPLCHFLFRSMQIQRKSHNFCPIIRRAPLSHRVVS